MSIATAAARLLNEAGVSSSDILRDAGVDREGAVLFIAEQLGVNLSDLVEPAEPTGIPVEVPESEVDKIRAALPALNRIFS